MNFVISSNSGLHFYHLLLSFLFVSETLLPNTRRTTIASRNNEDPR